MRIHIYLCLIVLLSLPVYAESIYSGSVYSGDSFRIGNDTYSVIGSQPIGGEFSNNFSKVLIKKSGITDLDMVIGVGKCYEQDFYSYCFDKTTYDFDNPKTIAGDNIQPSMDIRIEHYDASITVDRPTSVIAGYGNETLISIDFTNSGIKDLIINYQEQIPYDIFIVQSDGFLVNNNLLTKSFIIAENSSLNLSYKIKYSGYLNKSWPAAYSYDYEGKTILYNLSMLTMSVYLPYLITDSISEQAVKMIDDEIIYGLSITNLDTQNTLNVHINTNAKDLDVDSMEYYARNPYDVINNGFFADAIIPVGSYANYTLVGKIGKLGNHTINSTLLVDINNKEFVIYLNRTYSLDIAELVPALTIDKTSINPGDNITLSILLNNTDQYNDYFFIYGTLNGLTEDFITYPNVNSGQSVEINRSYIVPSFKNTSESNITFTFKGIYRTRNGQEVKFNSEKSVPINKTYYVPAQIIKANNTNNTISANATLANNTKTGSTTLSQGNTKGTNVQNNANQNAEAPKKDFISQIFDIINNFVKKIFGRK